MKQNIIFGLLFIVTTITAHSQTRISKNYLKSLESKAKEYSMLGEDADFKTNSINETKWEDESAIILSQKTVFTFDKEGASAAKMVRRNLLGVFLAPVTLGMSVVLANSKTGGEIQVLERERRKILLRDNYAVDQFSIMYFRLNDGDAFAAQVIKKNGTILAINPADAIVEINDNEVPSIYTAYTDPPTTRYYNPNHYKIPIENLEPGDMIEYELIHSNNQSFYSNPDYKEFEPIYYSCSREMPVVNQAIEVITENDNYYMSHKSLNGAAAFKTEFRGSNKVYRWVDNNYYKKRDQISYVNPYRELPSIKFQILYARNNSKQYLWYNSTEDMSKDLPVENLASQAKTFWFEPEKLGSTGSYFRESDTKIVSGDLYKWLKKHDVTDGSDSEYIQKAYYLVRAYTVQNGWNDYKFAKIFSALLAEKNIKHEIVATPYNTRTNVANLAFSNELAWAIKYNKKFFTNPESNFNPGEVPVYLSGNVCILFPYDNQKATPSTDTVAYNKFTQNSLSEKIIATLDPTNNSTLTVEKLTLAAGHVKNNIIEDVLAFTPYLEKDFQNYDGEGPEKTMTASSRLAFENTKKSWKEKEKPEYMKTLVEQDLNFDVEKYDLFQLINDGRSFKNQNLEFKEKYTLSRFTSLADKDILIGLPSLIGSQSRINKQEQNQRAFDIDVSNARSLKWQIEMPIPTGYTAAGFENINISVDNKCASFMSSGKVVDGKIILDVTKTYKVAKMPASDWPLLLEMLNAAYNFSQSKIVLQKQP